MRRHLLVLSLALTSLLFATSAEAGCPFIKQTSNQGVSYHRHLLQANCALQFNGQPQTFKACQDLSSAIGAPYNLLWSVTDEGNGSSILSGALNVQSSGWAAWGLPATPGSGMIGGSAVVVKVNASAPSGASVDNYYLGGYATNLVKPPGKLDLISASAAKAGDNLQALFQMRLPSSGASLAATPTDYLMALGQLDPAGNLMQHADSQGVENTVNLGAGLANAAAPATAPASAPASAPAAAATAPAPHQATGVATLAAAAPPSSAPADSGAGCSLQLNGKSQDFQQCKTLTSGVQLLWNLADQPGGGSLMQAALQCTGDGWCGWGLPVTPGKMVGASAVIVKTCPTCPSGASADNYLLAAKQASGVQPGTGKLDLADISQATKTPDGTLVTLFTMRLDPSQAAPSASTDCIAAHGPVGPDGSLQPHTDAMSVAGTVALASGTVAVAAGPTLDNEVTAHGVLMTVAWAIILPISIVIAHSMRSTLKNDVWFQVHRALGIVSAACILAGFGLGVYLWVYTPLDNTLLAHVVIGVITTAFVILQALAVVARPNPDYKYRSAWNHYHHNVGRVAVILAFANAILGFYIGGLGWGWYLGLALIWTVIWILGGAKSFYDLRRIRHGAFLHKKAASESNGLTNGNSGGTELTGQKNGDGRYTML